MKRQSKHQKQRGAVLVESAFVVGTIFLMLFGTVSIATIGFDQMSADGAAFDVAHETSVGPSTAPQLSAASAFPNIPQSQINVNLLPAPTPSIPVDYGYNDSSTANQASSVNQRFGGVAMMQPEQVQGVAQKTSSSILGNPINVVGTMIEPLWLENGLHFDAANSDTYGSTSGGTAFQGNVFAMGENTPPYYVGFDLVDHCEQSMPWYSCSSTGFTPLGTAEFLDWHNWCMASPTPSTGGGCSGTLTPAGASGSAAGDSTFAAASCHQRAYAQIADFLYGKSTLISVLVNDSFTSVVIPTAYYLLPTTNSNSFAVFHGYDGGPTDAAIRQVYSWDGIDVSGTPPPGVVGDTLYPENGC